MEPASGAVRRCTLIRTPTKGFYIGAGELTFVFGDREVIAGPGSFVFVARGVQHTAHITKALRGLLIYSPGDAEHITQPV